MSIILCIAPHPDDETLGCGGTLLKHKSNSDEIHWLIMSKLKDDKNLARSKAVQREKEIKEVYKSYGFNSMQEANFEPTSLDAIPRKKLIDVISKYFNKVKPDIVYLPFEHDVHSDHRVVFDSTISCIKSFRYPFIKKVCAYETVSESEFNVLPKEAFQPNMWVDISPYLEDKIKIMKLYKGELGKHPFPRSSKNIKALATFRGSTINVNSAEAFIVLKEVL